ncbi:MAG: sulfatase [Lachnospiraceae bacterium]
MKAIMIMFDSLNRNYLPCYGNQWVKAPNFERLQKKSLTFDRFYAGSLPCMPARRELHTGRYNFLHRSWGPLEPFDVSTPGILRKNGIYSHLVTDHFHYFEEGGATYHTQYNSWECVRGQQGDAWKGNVADPHIPECENPRTINLDNWRQDWVNRQYLDHEAKQPMPVSFELGLEFIQENKKEDNWFLQLETFDPHEPFYTMNHYKELYARDYKGKHYDWPNYGKTNDPNETIDHMRKEYAALVTMCDTYLGKVLDIMDEENMWEDTMLIVNTDHGFMLGEKEWYGKNIQPFYNEIAQIPFFLYDPRNPRQGERRQSLCQTIDIAPTILEYFGLEVPDTMEGKPLSQVVDRDEKIRDCALFGMFGGHVNIVDDDYVYMRANQTKDNGPSNEYTLMPTHMRSMFKPAELEGVEIVPKGSFSFQCCPVMKIPCSSFLHSSMYGNLLFDIHKDPEQENPIRDAKVEYKMAMKLIDAMKKSESPKEQFLRLGLKDADTIEEFLANEHAFQDEEPEKKELSADSSLGVILQDPQGKKILESILGERINNPMLKMAMGLSPRTLQEMAGNQFPKEIVDQIDHQLNQLNEVK